MEVHQWAFRVSSQPSGFKPIYVIQRIMICSGARLHLEKKVIETRQGIRSCLKEGMFVTVERLESKSCRLRLNMGYIQSVYPQNRSLIISMGKKNIQYSQTIALFNP